MNFNDKASKLKDWTRNNSGWDQTQIDGMIQWIESLERTYREVEESDPNPYKTDFKLEGLEAELDAWADML